MPAFVAVAVLLVLSLLLPSMLTNNSSNDKASMAILNEDGKEDMKVISSKDDSSADGIRRNG